MTDITEQPKANWISDSDATKLAQQHLSADDFARFCRSLEELRHFESCLLENTPSPRCRYTDLTENLQWCRLGLQVAGAEFEDLLNVVLMRDNGELS